MMCVTVQQVCFQVRYYHTLQWLQDDPIAVKQA